MTSLPLLFSSSSFLSLKPKETTCNRMSTFSPAPNQSTTISMSGKTGLLPTFDDQNPESNPPWCVAEPKVLFNDEMFGAVHAVSPSNHVAESLQSPLTSKTQRLYYMSKTERTKSYAWAHRVREYKSSSQCFLYTPLFSGKPKTSSTFAYVLERLCSEKIQPFLACVQSAGATLQSKNISMLLAHSIHNFLHR
jgi:hypothetical protein